MSAPSYPGPKKLTEALSAFRIQRGEDVQFHREGLRPDSEYRDLGLSAATGGKLGVKHIRAIGPFEQPTGWHWHDMHAHFIYVLRGWIRFRFAGVDDEVTLRARRTLRCWSSTCRRNTALSICPKNHSHAGRAHA